jgi:hypothetical protein
MLNILQTKLNNILEIAEKGGSYILKVKNTKLKYKLKGVSNWSTEAA